VGFARGLTVESGVDVTGAALSSAIGVLLIGLATDVDVDVDADDVDVATGARKTFLTGVISMVLSESASDSSMMSGVEGRAGAGAGGEVLLVVGSWATRCLEAITSFWMRERRRSSAMAL
jgi:hypothetical protein